MDEVKLIAIDFSLASEDMIEVLLEDVAEPGIYEEITRANMQRPEILRLVAEHPLTPEEVRSLAAAKLNLPVVPKKDLVRIDAEKEARAESLLQKIQKLTVSARIHLALKGGREIRNILSRDTNKEVVLSLLQNGKITDGEIEIMARSRSALEETLRRISKNREWMRKYPVVYAVVTNPKTPPGIAVTFISDLKTKDLVLAEKNKNMAQAVRAAAKRVVQFRKTR